MKTVTKKAIEAFEYKRNLSIGNTQVISNGAVSGLYLHGNLIAEKIYDGEGGYEIRITNAGWFTNTTKERLNGITGNYINQRAGQWYLNGKQWDGKWITIRKH